MQDDFFDDDEDNAGPSSTDLWRDNFKTKKQRGEPQYYSTFPKPISSTATVARVYWKTLSHYTLLLKTPFVQQSYDRYGIAGLRTALMQELIKMERKEVTRELYLLLQVEDDEIKAAMQAVWHNANQWANHRRRPQDMRDKADWIASVIDNFHAEIPLEMLLSDSQGESITFAEQPDLIPPEPEYLAPIAAQVSQTLKPGDRLLICFDLDADLSRWERYLKHYDLIKVESNQWIWKGRPGDRVIAVGNLFTRGETCFELIIRLRQLMEQAPDAIGLCLGRFDLSLISEYPLFNPWHGYASVAHGPTLQAYLMPVLISFIRGTAFSTPDHPYSAWEWVEDGYVLKPEFQVDGKPYLRLTADENGLPDIAPLQDFLMSLGTLLGSDPLLDEVDQWATAYLDDMSVWIDIRELATSDGRQALLQGMLKTTGILSFLRDRGSTVYQFDARGNVVRAFHPSLSGEILAGLHEAKQIHWQIPSLDAVMLACRLLKTGSTTVRKPIQHPKAIESLHQIGLSDTLSVLSVPAETFYEYLEEQGQLKAVAAAWQINETKEIFKAAWTKIQQAMAASYPYLAQIALSQLEPGSDRNQLRRVANLDPETRQNYLTKVLQDNFANPIGWEVEAEEDFSMSLSSQSNLFKMNLHFEPEVGIYLNPEEDVRVPIHHAIWLEFRPEN